MPRQRLRQCEIHHLIEWHNLRILVLTLTPYSDRHTSDEDSTTVDGSNERDRDDDSSDEEEASGNTGETGYADKAKEEAAKPRKMNSGFGMSLAAAEDPDDDSDYITVYD